MTGSFKNITRYMILALKTFFTTEYEQQQS